MAGLLVLATGFSIRSEFSQVESLINTGFARLTDGAASGQTRLTINTTPAGARVFVDDELVGVAPFAEVAVAEGTRFLRIQKDGFVVVDTAIVVSGSREMSIQLTAAAGSFGGHESAAARLGLNDSRAGTLQPLEVSGPVFVDSTGSYVDGPAALDSSYVGIVLHGVPKAAPARRMRPLSPAAESVPSTRAIVLADSLDASAGVAGLEIEMFEQANRRGDAAFAAGRYRDAINAFEEANRLRPGLPTVIDKIRMSHAALERAELPSSVFSVR